MQNKERIIMMSQEQDSTQETKTGQSQTDSGNWDEVGRQFQALGESLAAAFRTAWGDEENRQQMHKVKIGLEDMANQVSQAIKDSSASPAAQQARDEAKKAATSLQDAGKQALEDAKPHLLSALRQIDLELKKLIERMEREESSSSAPDNQDLGQSSN